MIIIRSRHYLCQNDGMVYIADSKSAALGLVGSNPISGTTFSSCQFTLNRGFDVSSKSHFSFIIFP